MTKKSRQKRINILRTKRAFHVKQKAFSIIFKGLLVAKNCLRTKGAPLSLKDSKWKKIIFPFSNARDEHVQFTSLHHYTNFYVLRLLSIKSTDAWKMWFIK